MRIDERYYDLEKISEGSCRKIVRGGEIQKAKSMALQEHVIDVYVNTVLTMKLVCTPEYLTELVLGRLLTEGIISSAEDVRTIYVCQYGKRARVFLKEKLTASQYACIAAVFAGILLLGISEGLAEA